MSFEPVVHSRDTRRSVTDDSPHTNGSSIATAKQEAGIKDEGSAEALLMEAMGSASSGGLPSRPHRLNPLHFSTLQLQQQPNGGYGRILIKVRPHSSVSSLSAAPPVTSHGTVYCSEREMEEARSACNARRSALLYSPTLDGLAAQDTDGIAYSPLKPFWFRTNEGGIVCFETDYASLKSRFGVCHGERLLSTWGPTAGTWSTVIGVREGCLWVKDDGAAGAMALCGLTSKAALEHALGWVSHGAGAAVLLEPATTVTVPVVTYEKDSVEFRTLAVDPDTMELCFGKGIVHGSIHVVTTITPAGGSLGLESVDGFDVGVGGDALFFVPVGVDTTNGDLVAFFVTKSQAYLSSAMMGALGRAAASTAANDPDSELKQTVVQKLLFGGTQTFPLNRSSVTPSLVFAHVLEGVQNPKGVAALLRPVRLMGHGVQCGAQGAEAGAGPARGLGGRARTETGGSFSAHNATSLGVARAEGRPEQAALRLYPAARIFHCFDAHRHHGPLPLSSLFAARSHLATRELPRHSGLSVREPCVQFTFKAEPYSYGQ